MKIFEFRRNADRLVQNGTSVPAVCLAVEHIRLKVKYIIKLSNSF